VIRRIEASSSGDAEDQINQRTGAVSEKRRPVAGWNLREDHPASRPEHELIVATIEKNRGGAMGEIVRQQAAKTDRDLQRDCPQWHAVKKRKDNKQPTQQQPKMQPNTDRTELAER